MKPHASCPVPPQPGIRSLATRCRPIPAQLDRDHLWHPFTQQQAWCRGRAADDRARRGLPPDRQRRAAATSTASPRSGATSTATGTPASTPPCASSSSKVAHTTMLGLSHPGAAELAARLVDLAPAGLSRVFYSESGSTAVEIALKMAFQYQQQRGGQHRRRTSFVHLRDSYHGDTIGSVSVGGIDLFHSTYRPLLFQTHARGAGRRRRPRAGPRLPRRGDRRGDRRAAGPGRGRDARPTRPATCARCASSATASACC